MASCNILCHKNTYFKDWTVVKPKIKTTNCRKRHHALAPAFSHAAVCFLFSSSCLPFQSFTAALMASSASIEQWSFTGGSFKCAAISEFLMASTSSTLFPFTHSVATEDAAIAEPHPKVLKTDSTIFPSSSTLIWSFITSPQAGAPTRPCIGRDGNEKFKENKTV